MMKVLIINKPTGNPAFANLDIGTIHDIIPTPKNESGLWVMGVGEPVKLLQGEFRIINTCDVNKDV